MSWNFVMFYEILFQMLKVSAFYLEKQKSFIPKKKYDLGISLKLGQESSNRCRFALMVLGGATTSN